MRTIRLTLGFTIALAALVGTSRSGIAQEPDILYQVCLDPGDRADRALKRTECDGYAESLGYQSGVVRPLTPNDEVKSIACKNPEAKVHVCAGAGGSPDN